MLFCILTSNQFWKNSQEITCGRASFLLKLREKRVQHSRFPVNFAKLLRTLFYRTPSGDYSFRSWREVARVVLALFLMTDFKES